MRIGTQTLIQALQALPWIDHDNDDEGSNQEQDAVESENEDEANHRGTRELHHIIPSLSFPQSTPLHRQYMRFIDHLLARVDTTFQGLNAIINL